MLFQKVHSFQLIKVDVETRQMKTWTRDSKTQVAGEPVERRESFRKSLLAQSTAGFRRIAKAQGGG